MMTTILAILSTNAFAGIIKKAVQRFGQTGVRIMVLCVSALVVCAFSLSETFPPVKLFLAQVATLFAGAITMYHVLWKPIGDAIKRAPIDDELDDGIL